MKDIYTAMQEFLGLTPETLAIKLAEHRMVPVNGKMDREKSDAICRTIIAFEMKEIAPITLLISSGGGDVSSSNSIGDMIQSIYSPVDGLIIDHAESMAVDILLMCRVRRALPHAEFFVHFTRSGFKVVADSDTITNSEIATFKKRMTANKKAREDFYMARLGKSRKEIHDLFRLGEKYDLYYTAQEALRLGIIDEIDTTFKYFIKPPKKK